MRRLSIFAMAICLLALSLPATAREVLDRIIAIVNNTPILLSEWDEEWRCEALLAGRTPDSYTPAEQQEIFDRLVDQELMQQQMHGYLLPPVSPADVQERLRTVRAQLFNGASDAQWQAALQRAGITLEELTVRVQRQIEIERFVDLRFRPGIHIDDRSINRYYHDQFLPELREQGAQDVPLEQVSGKIREILTQQRLQEQVAAWIQTLHEQAEIRIPPAIPSDANEIEITQSK